MALPEPGEYRRIKDGKTVTVVGCSGPGPLDTVAVRSPRLSHVRVENFWRKYLRPTDTTQTDL